MPPHPEIRETLEKHDKIYKNKPKPDSGGAPRLRRPAGGGAIGFGLDFIDFIEVFYYFGVSDRNPAPYGELCPLWGIMPPTIIQSFTVKTSLKSMITASDPIPERLLT